jgi:hypothetical protein
LPASLDTATALFSDQQEERRPEPENHFFFTASFRHQKKKKQITFKTLGLTAPVISDVTGASGKLRLDLKPTGLDEFEDLVVVGLGSAGEIEFFCGVLFISLE